MVLGPPAARETYSAAFQCLRAAVFEQLEIRGLEVAQQLAAAVGDDGRDADRAVRLVAIVGRLAWRRSARP